MATMLPKVGLYQMSKELMFGLNTDEVVGISIVIIAILGLLFSRMSGGDNHDTDI